MVRTAPKVLVERMAARAPLASVVGMMALLSVAIDGCGDDEPTSGCPAGQILCGGVCCDGVCLAGECVGSCPSPMANCSGHCADLDSDPNHCGSCGASCDADQVCASGQCRGECPSGQTDCGGSCADLQTDRDHCGSCDAPCGDDEQCAGGSCLPSVTAEGFTSQGPGDSDVPAALYGTREIVLDGGDGDVANPFDTDLTVTFTPPSGASNAITVNGFYDGGDSWRARLYVAEAGDWSWSSASVDDAGLAGHSGAFTAVPSGLRGKMRKHPDSDHQWATEDGRYFLTIADTPYLLFNEEYSQEIFERYVADVAARGVSLMRAGLGGGYSVWDPDARASGGQYPRANWIHDGWDYDRFDLPQLQATDERLAWLLNHHPSMYVDLHLLPKTENCGERWYQELSAEQRERTMRYLVARLAGWPQVLFLIQRDVPQTYDTWQQNIQLAREVGNYLADHDPFDTFRGCNEKPREINQLTEPSDFDDWESYLEVQSWGSPYGRVVDYYYDNVSYLPVHVYHGEDKYEEPWNGIPAHPAYYYRRLLWSDLLSGGSGTYGSKYKSLIPYSESGSTEYHYDDGSTDTTQLSGLDETIHIVEFVDQYGIDMAELSPDDGLVRLEHAPSPEGDAGPSRAQCAHDGAERFLVYHPNAADGETSSADINDTGQVVVEHVASRLAASLEQGRIPAVELDLTAGGGVSFGVTWFHPTTGQSHDGGTVTGGQWTLLTAPAAFEGSDAVLLVRAQ
ncbi:MAG: DUF5060 domain-containing protein [Deltaproteobacteria bacterium]|jgi:hypothetical protein|nr:DUF5060 domain-containing protein [Deltaproteobacteria bacterium]MBW2530931.1 DUF5060 domain-containing protein [Deltaproteobacteria bacterium]